MARSLLSTMSTWSFWTSSSIVGSIALIRIAPQYTIWQSYYWTAIALFLAQASTYLFYILVLYHRFFSPLRHLPTVRDGNHWLLGQFPTFAREPSGVPMRRWAETIPNDGLIRYLHLFNRERILVTSPKALTEVMNTRNYDFVKPELLRIGIGKLLGEGVLLAERDDHKHQRKALAPAFSFRHIKEMYPIFWGKSVEMVRTIEKDDLKPDAPKTDIEVGEWFSRATLDIIGLGGMGQDFNALADPDTELNKTYRTVFAPNRQARILSLIQFFVPPWIVSKLPIKRNDDMFAAAKVARDTSRRLVRTKKARLEKKEKMSPDIISIALESGVFDEDLLVDNMMTFLAAGHETTASAMTWAIYLLCKHPEYQKRLREEVHNHITDLNATVSDTTIDSMPLLHAVCQETLRVYSPVPLTLRKADVDTIICDTAVPRGTMVMLVPWATNFAKELWGPDAAEFNPDRWMKPGHTNTGGASSNYAFLTFLHGPRSCIGSKFAVSEMACLLAAFVGKFEFSLVRPDEEVEIRSGVTAKPEKGLHVTLKAVQDW